jgi:hypothetical protein
MLKWLKRIARRMILTPYFNAKRIVGAIFSPYFNQFTPLQVGEIAAIDKATQLLLSMKYKEILYLNMPLPRFEDVGFRAFSQNDEDGILLYIFSGIGTTNKKCVEICAGDGIENNTANLIINHGWTGFMVDGNKMNVKRGQDFYSQCRDTIVYPPVFINAWVNTENVDSLISSYGFRDEIDLLSIDLDGVDYWVWKAIACINPRVVILEYNNVWEADKSVTIPYDQDFNRYDTHPQYWGASLSGFVKLGREKGYRLVGCNRYCFNAFFIRIGVGDDIFPEIVPDTCFGHPYVKHKREKFLSQLNKYDWVEV